MRLPANVHSSLIRRYSSSWFHLRVRSASISARPVRDPTRLRQLVSGVYASATLAASRLFQPSSARRTFWVALCSSNGGRGGRDMAALLGPDDAASEWLRQSAGFESDYCEGC